MTDIIGPRLIGQDASRQTDVDRMLIGPDGTENKSRLGANATVTVSMAVSRAAAASAGLPLYAYLGGPSAYRLPVPTMNGINGGKHGDNAPDSQEFMIVLHGAPSLAEALRYGAETFQALHAIREARGFPTGVGDEGVAPNLESNEAACALIVEAICKAGYRPGPDIAIGLDPAASSFASDGGYDLARSHGGRKTSELMTELCASWIATYPIAMLEDGLADDDWAGLKHHTATLGAQVEILGDDLYVTNTEFIARGIKERSTNAVLIKLNQIGTVTETIEAICMCQNAGWHFLTSHRSGETEDPCIADFAVAMGGADQDRVILPERTDCKIQPFAGD